MLLNSDAGMKLMKLSNIWNTVFIVCIMRTLESTTCFSLCMPSRSLFLDSNFRFFLILKYMLLNWLHIIFHGLLHINKRIMNHSLLISYFSVVLCISDPLYLMSSKHLIKMWDFCVSYREKISTANFFAPFFCSNV